MKRLALFLAACGVLVAINTPASASDLSRFIYMLARQQEAQHQRELHRRAVEREILHDEAHQLPMTRRQHGQLHGLMEQEAVRDQLEHAAAHGFVPPPAPSCRPAPPPPCARPSYGHRQPVPYGYGRGGHGHGGYGRHTTHWGFGFQTPRGVSFFYSQ